MVLRFAVAAHRVQALLISGLSNNPAASQSVHLAHRLLISCLTCCLFGSINQSLHLGMRRPKFCRKLMIFFKKSKPNWDPGLSPSTTDERKEKSIEGLALVVI